MLNPDAPSRPGGPSAGDPVSQFLGVRWDGAYTVRLGIRPDLVNLGGMLLGPVAFALVDYAMTSALWAHTTEDEGIATVNISINYVASAKAGEVVCTAKLDRRNRRLAVLTSETRHEDGRLLATAIGSFTIYPLQVRSA
jgi:uncharacterized protein (TIGR00369 family)